ncbi:cupin domain-containing protein [Gluconobacter wancherniae]|uniref:cupin domain-containing protein n=1 Tax=Gluconobacter wancherniae TaxID=1307955 RepID=UPI0031FE6AF1
MRFVAIGMLVCALNITAAYARGTQDNAQEWIARFDMRPVPVEGGWFAQVLRTPETIPGSALPSRYAGVAHPASTAILYVETRKGFSALHRLKTDEVWHFYGGDPIRLLLLYPDGHGKTVLLDRHHPFFVVPEGVWQGSAPVGSEGWSVAGTTMAPGFIDSDFEIGDRASLSRSYPAFRSQISALTRTEVFKP